MILLKKKKDTFYKLLGNWSFQTLKLKIISVVLYAEETVTIVNPTYSDS